MSRAAGYADFFPAAPSVLAKKAQAERAAKEKEKARRAHEEYDRDSSGAQSAGSTASAASVPTQSHLQLTPATSNSSPPDVSPTKSEKLSQADPPAPPSMLTPKATPPAVAKPDVRERNCRILYDPVLDRGDPPADKDTGAKKPRQPLYRYEGQGVRTCILSSILLISHYPFPIPHSPFSIPRSSFPIPHTPLSIPHSPYLFFFFPSYSTRQHPPRALLLLTAV